MQKSYTLSILFCCLISLCIAINSTTTMQNDPNAKQKNTSQKKLLPKKTERPNPPAENSSAKKSTSLNNQLQLSQPTKK